MRLRKPLFSARSASWLYRSAAAKDAPRSFSLSTSRTFSPGESVKIQLLARNVPELEFRVYKVRDAQKFFAGLKDLHSFGVQSYSPPSRWTSAPGSSACTTSRPTSGGECGTSSGPVYGRSPGQLPRGQGNLGKRSRVVGATQFAQVPLLNQSQLVRAGSWKRRPLIVSETQQLPIDGLAAGVYLIEATDGTYKAYTVAIVDRIAVVERTENGEADLYVADRETGAPVGKADVLLWAGSLAVDGQTDGWICVAGHERRRSRRGA